LVISCNNKVGLSNAIREARPLGHAWCGRGDTDHHTLLLGHRADRADVNHTAYIQLDNPGYGAFVGAHVHGERSAFERMVDTDAAAVAAFVALVGYVRAFPECASA
jgi:hypothetical protein